MVLGTHSSHLLEPFKIIGLVTNHVVPAISFQSNTSDDSDLIDDALIYCSIGNTFYAYGLKSLIHIDIGPQLPSPISYMLVERQSSLTSNASTAHPTQRDILYVCCEDSSKIYVLRGARELITILDTSIHHKCGKLVQLLKIGQYLLVCFEHVISIYDTFELQDSFVNAFELPQDCTLNCACHLQTYLDKIIIGCKEGHFLLFNFRVGKEIFRFEKHLKYFESLQEPSSSSSSHESSLLHSLLNTVNSSNSSSTPSISQITCLKPSPALDVIAIGTSCGHVILYHVKYDHILNVYKQNGPVSAISFRSTSTSTTTNTTNTNTNDSTITDMTSMNSNNMNSKQYKESSHFIHSEHVMATGNHCGEVSLWDLNSHQIIHRIKKHDRHGQIMTCCEFLPGEPFMVTCSSDNVMTLLAFDRVDKPREVVCRMGHKKCPKIIRFYDPMGHFIVTGGVDGQIRVTSLLDPRESKQISQQQNSHLWKSNNSQMPAITDMDICYLRQDDWNNLACCHSNLNSVTLWNVKYLKSDSETLYKPELKYGLPQSVALSICGNYAVVGTNKGYLEKWIIQSKKMKHLYYHHEEKERSIEIRKVYDFKGRQKTLKQISNTTMMTFGSHSLTAHSSPINSVIIDNTNTKVCSGGHDGLLKVWKFENKTPNHSSHLLNEIMNGVESTTKGNGSKHSLSTDQLLASFDLKSPILKMVKSKHSASANFVSVACENFSIHVFDMNTCKLIRSFHGHHINKINDMCFTHDNRYLISCGSDNYILIYDILTGQLIDWLSLPKAATSVDFHPEGLYLVTTHVNSVGICLWANKTIFGNALLQSVNAPKYVSLPFSGDSLMVTERTDVSSLNIDNQQNERQSESLQKRKRAFKILSKVDDWMKESMNEKNEESTMTDDSSSDDDDDESESSMMTLSQKQQKQMDTYPIQEPSHFIKLSGLAKYKWHSLTHLDELRKKNKLDPKKQSIPELDDFDSVNRITPFFIPTQPSLSKNIQFTKKKKEEEDYKTSHLLSSNNNTMMNPLIAMIKQDQENSSYSATMKYIKDSSIKQLDLNIRTLSAFNNYEEYKLLLEFFLHFVQEEFTDFDLIQALMNLFFQIHSDVLVEAIREDSEIRQFIERLSHANRVAFEPLDEMNKYNQCMIDYMSFGGVFI
ncbi:hypothetical protein C9374_007723 [Naegleria lovaniensis]|uniref:Guanine nucleotide-binding protein subunit beta-like protein n=1 Tax=Naegleria lovaniensis TaxID=51637 RepID=A0AA88GLQ8_NAELO|nr:uncharacterized protein C9374_007723 [Naegleria lovaniensis]KAG2379085.1 hypothetical protein C9374_007723 [Naegleria lovaniensis]